MLLLQEEGLLLLDEVLLLRECLLQEAQVTLGLHHRLLGIHRQLLDKLLSHLECFHRLHELLLYRKSLLYLLHWLLVQDRHLLHRLLLLARLLKLLLRSGRQRPSLHPRTRRRLGVDSSRGQGECRRVRDLRRAV